jgi:hypothetical protein
VVEWSKHPVQPGALRSLQGVAFAAPGSDEGERRAALAQWIADPRNVLTWRSIVNRVWHHHFGAGIADSPNDFGRMGSPPVNTELLDSLAVWFRDEAKGSLKQLHRLLVTSAMYRQSSQHRDDAAAIDGENRLLWRMNRSRLDAESTRDAVLQAAGALDLTMGGPAVRLFAFKDDHSPVYDYANNPVPQTRRSIYRFIVRSAPDPFFERLDCPDPSASAPKRNTTLTAVQALVMMNDPFVIEMSRRTALASRNDVATAVRRILARDPSSEAEQRRFESYTARHGLAALCRLLFNSNEFAFID